MGRISALFLTLFAGLIIGTTATASAGTTLDRIKAVGSLTCGINTEEPEYSTQDAHGNHGAFDLEICKAVAVATLGPNAKFTVKPYRDEQNALKALKSGEIALLATGSPNYINTANAGFGFSRPIFYDYQGFLVNKTMGIRSPRDLAGKKVCFLGGTEIEMQIQGYMKREKIDWLPFSFQEEGEMEAAFITTAPPSPPMSRNWPTRESPSRAWRKILKFFPTSSPKIRWRRPIALTTHSGPRLLTGRSSL
jgi:general L-amino acid transport system substrate-binding protein